MPYRNDVMVTSRHNDRAFAYVLIEVRKKMRDEKIIKHMKSSKILKSFWKYDNQHLSSSQEQSSGG